MDSLYIVVPAYNEEENIEQLVDEWYPVVENHSGGGLSRLVVVNDGSCDHTAEILERLTVRYPCLVPLTKPNGGHGSAVLFGYRYAAESGADFVFQTDSDGQTDPREFEKFWKCRNSYDAVFGMRPMREDGADRAFVEKVLCMILKVYFGVMLPDANAPYRLMRRSYLEEFLPYFEPSYNLPNAMLTVFGASCGKKIRFIPITFRKRRAGNNSINPKKIVRIGVQALADFAHFRKVISAKKR